MEAGENGLNGAHAQSHAVVQLSTELVIAIILQMQMEANHVLVSLLKPNLNAWLNVQVSHCTFCFASKSEYEDSLC